ncbi:hypothetical protein TNCV_10791 [Trichonephila clavipes]|nr:hypothetical protein TNCV_10791 [Trichonephila clavipes]
MQLTNPFGEYPPFQKFTDQMSQANIGLQDLIPVPHSSPSASLKDMEVYATIQRDACPDYQFRSMKKVF